MKHIKVSSVDLKSHPDLNEVWVHSVIAEDPSILALGDVIVKDRERIQPGAGRLDLMLQDADGPGRYEVEIQLGPTDPSHIIRTIEYWDRERKRYPQYEHTAVIIAEDITSRFLNVIGLFNGTIPIMALQMKAVEMPGGVGLIFTKVMDTLQLGLVDDDEEESEPMDRAYWESRASTKTVKLAEQVLEFCRPFAGSVEFSFNKHYIGIWVDGKACNFATLRPRKNALVLHIKLPKEAGLDARLEQHELDLLEYDRRWKNYRVRLSSGDIGKHEGLLKELLKLAYDRRKSS
jgi:hypothetical protein